MLEVLDRGQAAPHGGRGDVRVAPSASDETEACGECHFWHFGHCVHVTRYGHVGDGACSHRREARPILG